MNIRGMTKHSAKFRGMILISEPCGKPNSLIDVRNLKFYRIVVELPNSLLSSGMFSYGKVRTYCAECGMQEEAERGTRSSFQELSVLPSS